MKRELLLLSILEGAAVMIAELCGARLLAPVFGSSLYVWASVMGITLAALAAGYYFGGHLVKSKTELSRSLKQILSAAALALAVMPLLAFWVLPYFSAFPFKIGMVISTCLILAPPVFFLGSSTALFIQLQVNTTTPAGSVSGTVYAVSTLGGIAATFLAGFWLIPNLGLQFTLLLSAALLFVASAIVLKNKNYWLWLIAALSLALHLKLYLTRAKLLYFSDGILGQIAVVDKKVDATSMRYLLVNKIIQTEVNLATKKSTAEYLQLFDTLVKPSATPKAALILGLGGGSNANNLVSKGYKTTAVDFDERVVFVAKHFFNLSDSVTTLVDDARYFLNTNTQTFDIIIADLYKAEEQPAHLFTVEALRCIRNKLNNNGKFYVCWHGYLTEQHGLGTHVLLNTLNAAGFHIKIHSTGVDENTRNLIIEAAVSKFEPGAERTEISIPSIHTIAINTDDNLCLERYNTSANERWRQLYLAYYSQTSLY